MLVSLKQTYKYAYHRGRALEVFVLYLYCHFCLSYSLPWISWIFISRTDAEAETPYFGHLIWRTDSLEKTVMLGKIDGGRRRGWQRMRWLDGITDLMDMSLVNSRSWQWTGTPGVLQSMGSQRVRRDWATELNWWLVVGVNLVRLCVCAC